MEVTDEILSDLGRFSVLPLDRLIMLCNVPIVLQLLDKPLFLT